MSEHKNLWEALAAFQAEMPTVPKSKTAKVKMKTGGEYSYSYADLADVTAAAMPLLSAHGLAFSALPRQSDKGYELAGCLMHTTGETLDGALPLSGQTAQEIGSSITYMRRYLLGCLTGIVTDDDDDGRAASQPRKPAAKPAPKPPAESPASDAQVQLMREAVADATLSPSEFASVLLKVAGRPAKAFDSEAEAANWVDAALVRWPARLVQSVVAETQNLGAVPV